MVAHKFFIAISIVMAIYSCKQDATSPNAQHNQVDNTLSTIPSTTSISTDTIHASDIEELVKQAQDNRVIILNDLKTTLSKDLVYFITKTEKRIINKKTEETRSVGGQLFISGLENFHIIGNQNAQIISENNLSIPLYIANSINCTVQNIRFSHTFDKSKTYTNPISYIINSESILIDNCTFDNTGTYGIQITNTTNIEIAASKITNCKQGILHVVNGKNININNCTFSKNTCLKNAFVLFGGKNALIFENTSITNNTCVNSNPDRKMIHTSQDTILFTNCNIMDNSNFTALGINTVGMVGNKIQEF